MSEAQQIFATAALFLVAALAYWLGRLHQANKDGTVREELAVRNAEVEFLHAELTAFIPLKQSVPDACQSECGN